MAVPVLTPASTLSAVVLPSSGNPADVSIALPLGIYSSNTDFLSGAADQVAFVYKRLGGDVLDIELTTGNVYAAYEEAVLEYSYIVNLHQSINALPTMLGATTGSFNQDGEFKSGSALVGKNPELAYPKYNLHYVSRYGDAFATEAGIGGTEPIYSASFPITAEVQDYDLQAIIESASLNNYEPATGGAVPYASQVGNKRVTIRKVFYKTPNSMWRFFGYYGGLNAIGNLSSYGQYADDSTFEVIPTWHNKLQAMAYETAIYTRNSHFSYEIKNNRIRIYPNPPDIGIDHFWVEFTINNQADPWDVPSGSSEDTINGVNNMNTLPFANIPYNSINSIGKQWIRRYALAICKEMLGHVRSKFSTIPIPGESVTLNGTALMSEAKEEKKELKEELNKILDQITYHKLAEIEGKMSDDMQKLSQQNSYSYLYRLKLMEDNKLQEITFQSSTIETIDLAFYNWINYDMDLSATYSEGWKKVPITWVSAERTHQLKNNKDIRDSSGMIIYPIITIERKSVNKDPQKTGSIPANLRAVNDEKGGVITISRRVNQEKTSNFQSADDKRLNRSPKSNPVFPLNSTNYSKNKKIVYETITIPIPVHVAVTYQINIKTDYQQQLNELTTPFFTRNGNTRYIQLMQDGHKYDAFIKGDFNFENNSAQLNEERKTYSTTITVEVIGYLIGDDKNQISPKMVIRENAVDVKFPRERVILGDIQTFLNTSKNKTKYRP